MYAVIFRAEINKVDTAYSKLAAEMRNIAMEAGLKTFSCAAFRCKRVV